MGAPVFCVIGNCVPYDTKASGGRRTLSYIIRERWRMQGISREAVAGGPENVVWYEIDAWKGAGAGKNGRNRVPPAFSPRQRKRGTKRKWKRNESP